MTRIFPDNNKRINYEKEGVSLDPNPGETLQDKMSNMP